MLNPSYLLARSAHRFGDRPAVFHQGGEHGYRRLDERVSGLASALVALGLAAGDRVAFITDNEPRGIECIFGPLRAGLVIVPIGPRLHPKEQAYIVKDSGAKALVCGARFAQALVDTGELDAALPLVVMDASRCPCDGAVDYEAFIVSAPAGSFDDTVAPDDLAWLFYTSGTTGSPKGAMITHRNLWAMITTQLIEHNPIDSTDRYAYLTALSHGAGLAVFLQVARGAGHVFPRPGSFDADEFYALVERHRVTAAIMVPTQIQVLLDRPCRGRFDISSLRTICYGAAPMYVDRLREAIEAFGPIFTQTYGLGEAPRGITCLSKQDHAAVDADGLRRLGSAGRECLHVQVRVSGSKGLTLEPDQEGEVCVRGDLVMKGYWNNPAATAESIRDGWLHTGDIGYFDAQGYLFLTDRMKDIIITGGSNVYPREVEEVLYRHPAVLEACVFGVPDERWGERVTAAVVRRAEVEVTEEQLIEWCKAHVASYKKPAAITFVPGLPKSAIGKILRREAKQRYIAGAPA